MHEMFSIYMLFVDHVSADSLLQTASIIPRSARQLAQTCSLDPSSDNGFVMVGDSYNNHSVQFRDVISISDDNPSLRHPQYDASLYKIEPVSFDGFRPVKLQMDANAVSQGQNLTSVSYDLKDHALGFDFAGQAYECPLQVQDIKNELFTAKQWVVGPCMSALHSRSSVIATPKLLLTLYYLIVQVERPSWF